MVELQTFQFETIDDFENSMEDSEVLANLSKITVDRLQGALQEGLPKVDLYKVELQDTATTYTVSLAKKDWATTAQNCLSHLEKVGRVDDVIDTYQLIKQLKNL
jgi:hypothetical protein